MLQNCSIENVYMCIKIKKRLEDLLINNYSRNSNLYLEQMHTIREFRNV
nr:MAG TPA: hypothetical protein [Bacteriophage sp.]